MLFDIPKSTCSHAICWVMRLVFYIYLNFGLPWVVAKFPWFVNLLGAPAEANDPAADKAEGETEKAANRRQYNKQYVRLSNTHWPAIGGLISIGAFALPIIINSVELRIASIARWPIIAGDAQNATRCASTIPWCIIAWIALTYMRGCVESMILIALIAVVISIQTDRSQKYVEIALLASSISHTWLTIHILYYWKQK